jgi:hypothetical protein
MVTALKNVVVVGGSYVGTVSTGSGVEVSTMTMLMAEHRAAAGCPPSGYPPSTLGLPLTSLEPRLTAQILLVEPHTHFHHLFAFVSRLLSVPGGC